MPPVGRPHESDGRERVLAAALETFAEHGYEAASMASVAKRAGVVKSVVYHHFGSKAELYEEVLRAETDRVVDAVAAAMPLSQGEPRLRPGVDAYLTFLEANPVAWRLLFRDPPSDEALRQAYDEQRARRSKTLAKLITPRTGKGRLSASQKSLHTELLITGVRSFASWWQDHQDVPRQRVLDTIIAFADAGLEGLTRKSANR